jgi:hypothetical protein
MGLRAHLAVPYILVLESVRTPTGWVRRASLPELPGVVGESDDAFDAVELLNSARIDHITSAVRQGVPPLPPRRPLRHGRLED